MPEKTGDPGKKKNPLQTLLNVLGVILCVIFIPIIIVNVTMIVKSYTEPDEIPSVLGYSPLIVLSGSMSPEFEAGDLILLQKVDPADLKVNDIVCFREQETAVTHRIMSIQEQDGQKLFITKGDANNIEDLVPSLEEQIQGRYVGVRIPGLGDLAMFTQTTPGMLIFIGGPVVLFLLWDVLRRAVAGKKRKKADQQREAEASSKQQEMEAMAQELERLRAQMNAAGQQEDQNGPAGSPPGQ